jgi:hypothetical protein
MQERVRAVSGVEVPEAWLLDGIRQWIETFMEGRMTIRVTPWPAIPEFEVIGNLIDISISSDIEGRGLVDWVRRRGSGDHRKK